MTTLFKILFVALFLHFSSPNIAQQGMSLKSYPGRYALELPDEFKSQKMLRLITDILPATVEDLKNRDFCIDCLGSFLAKFIVDSFTIEGRVFHFKAVIRVYDNTTFPIAQLLIVSPTESFDLPKSQYPASKYKSSSTRGEVPVYDTTGRIVSYKIGIINSVELNEQSSGNTHVISDELLNICKSKIKEMHKNLEKLKLIE
jgi:hypothetical protein